VGGPAWWRMVLKVQEEIKRKQQKLKWTDELKSKAAFTIVKLYLNPQTYYKQTTGKISPEQT
jgi:hypothetical protein